jgi:hypothetical protein
MKRLCYNRVPMTIILSEAAQTAIMKSGRVSCSAEHIATVPGHSIFDSFFALLSVDAHYLIINQDLPSDNLDGTHWQMQDDRQPSGMGGRPCDPPLALIILLPRPG